MSITHAQYITINTPLSISSTSFLILHYDQHTGFAASAIVHQGILATTTTTNDMVHFVVSCSVCHVLLLDLLIALGQAA
jgi:hypothetical protein